jgi:hypothetical protein
MTPKLNILPCFPLYFYICIKFQKRNILNKKLIFQLSFFGLFMAVATVFWIPSTLEPIFWVVIFIICAYIIAKKCTDHYFFHGFLVSMLNSVWITAAHIFFFSTYISNHTEELTMMSRFPIPYSPRVAMLLIGPIFGAGFGIILGFFCFIASRIVKRK